MKRTFILLSLISLTAISLTSCDMFNDKKKNNALNNALNNLPKAATDKADWEVREKAEEFARRYSYAVLQDDWVKAEEIDNEMQNYKKSLTFADKQVFDQALENM